MGLNASTVTLSAGVASPRRSGASHTAESTNIAGRIERLPMTAYQRRVFAIIATAWLADQMDVALLTFLLGSIIVTFHLTPVHAGGLAAMTFAGQLIGNVAAGLTADRFGRIVVFQVTMVIWGLASFGAAAAWSLGALMAMRLLIGVGVGGEAPVAQAMVSELLPASIRGKYIRVHGGLLGRRLRALGCHQLLHPATLRVARGLRRGRPALACGLPRAPRHAGIAALARRPRPLRRRRRRDEHDRDAGSARTGRPLPPVPDYRTEAHEHANPLKTIFSRAYAKRTAMAMSVWFFALLGFFGLNSWIAVLLKSHGFTTITSVGFVTLITLGGIPGFFVTGLMLERVGRKPVTATVLICGAIAAYFYGTATTTPLLFVTGFIMQFFMFGMWSSLYAYTPELYPTRARATGAGFASAMGRVGAMIGPVFLPIVVTRYGQGAAFDLGASNFALAAIIVLVFGVETKGRVLENVSA